ncbi:LAMI_0G15412g1_1 [Lachancea mirantina]|uniref:LAMI_0G15412g1_1 n=1 Tax=Lachancea mirantina TaxID=1230905 RepID=A0A1G4KCC2_9SACH|nr:LAMI_0G15412g1_1 [Lachancea mirantina]
MASSLLTAQRLVQLAPFQQQLKTSWYLCAAAAFSVCNQPKEIPKLYHFALLSESRQEEQVMEVARQAIAIAETDQASMPQLLAHLYPSVTPFQKMVSEQFREALLKSSVLCGLPKAINSLAALKEATPNDLKPQVTELDPNDPKNALGPVRKSRKQSLEFYKEEGLEHWNHVYSKVSGKVMNNLNSSYPDLWYFALCHVYGPIIAFDEILNARETSLLIIACLVPQDVNAQLWGHLKGALNVGCSGESIEAARSMSILISKWCGVRWQGEIVKL